MFYFYIIAIYLYPTLATLNPHRLFLQRSSELATLTNIYEYFTSPSSGLPQLSPSFIQAVRTHTLSVDYLLGLVLFDSAFGKIGKLLAEVFPCSL